MTPFYYYAVCVINSYVRNKAFIDSRFYPNLTQELFFPSHLSA